MQKKGSRLRGRAAHLLVLAGSAPGTVELEALTIDKFPENRIQAAAALFRTGKTERANDVLLDEARSENWTARRLAIQTAAALEHPAAFAVLIAGLDDPEPSLRRSAWKALSILSGERLVFHPDAAPVSRQAAIHQIQEWYKRAYPEHYAETR
jgi:HEAT repeat protein